MNSLAGLKFILIDTIITNLDLRFVLRIPAS